MKLSLISLTAAFIVMVTTTSAEYELEKSFCECNSINSGRSMSNWLQRYFDSDMCSSRGWNFRETQFCLRSQGEPSGEWCAQGSGWALLQFGTIKCCRHPHDMCYSKLRRYCSSRGGRRGVLVRPSHDPNSLYSCS